MKFSEWIKLKELMAPQQPGQKQNGNPIVNAVGDSKNGKSKFTQKIKGTIAKTMGNPSRTKSALTALAKTAANDPSVTTDDMNTLASSLSGVK